MLPVVWLLYDTKIDFSESIMDPFSEFIMDILELERLLENMQRKPLNFPGKLYLWPLWLPWRTEQRQAELMRTSVSRLPKSRLMLSMTVPCLPKYHYEQLSVEIIGSFSPFS